MMYRKTFPEDLEKEETSTNYAGPSCTFTEGVSCPRTGRHCGSCGHNPEVSQARLRAFCEKHGIDMPVKHRQA